MSRFLAAFSPIFMGAILISLSFSSTAFAAPAQKLQFIAEGNVTASKIQERRNLLQSVNLILAPELALPPSVTVTVPPLGDNAYCMNVSRTHFEIMSPYQMSIEGVNAKNPRLTNGVLVHEYGHAVLQYNLMQRPAFRSRFRKYMKAYDIRTAFFKLQADAVKLAAEIEAIESKTTRTNAELARLKTLNAKMEKLQASAEVLETQFSDVADEYGTIETMLGDYHEFFADVVAVLHSGSPKIVWTALYSPEYRTRMKDDGKDLEKLLKVFHLRRFDKKVRVESYGHDEIHISLSPTRAYLYKYYIDNPLYHDMESKFLKATLDTILEEIIERNTRPGLITLIPEVMNRRLMAKIDRNFPKIAQPYIGGRGGRN